jgi:hypothetical protein
LPLVFTDTCGEYDCINAAECRRQVISPLMPNVKISIACRACGRLLASIAPSRKPTATSNG